METIIDNISSLWLFPAVSWAAVIIFTLWRPQKYFNSILLMVACFFTMLFVCGLFGENMGLALAVCFVIVMLALFMVPALLIANGIIVLKKESRSLPHLLSLILGVAIGIGEIATVIYVLGLADYVTFPKLHSFTVWLSMTVFYFSCLVLNFVLYSIFIELLPHRMNFDSVVIHGCGLKDGEKPTKLLASRIDKAIAVYQKCKKKPVIIPSGGKGPDEKISEAEAMKEYLLEKGIPEKDIILEDGSATTMENLKNSKSIIDALGKGKRTALVSSNYHIYRCLTYAKKLKFRCVGIGAKVAPYYWPTALIREFIAVFLTKKFLIWSLIGYLLFISPLIWVNL